MTNIGEFPNIRKTLLRQYQRQVFEGVGNNIFESYYQNIEDHINKGNYAGMIEQVLNYRSSIRIGRLNYDAFDMMLALITLEDGEDQYCIDEDFFVQKISRMNKAGLTSKQAYDNVVFFCKNSKEICQDFLQILQEL